MPKHNSASRLYLILQKGSELPNNMATLKAWASLFHMEEPYDVRLSIDVSERLLWLNQELEILKRQLDDSELDRESYAATLRHIEQALSTVYLATNWESVKQFLSADTLNPLASWAETFPETEIPVKQEELDEIRDQAQELEELFGSSTLTEELKVLVLQHVRLLRKALAGYPIVGGRALKAGTFSALGELVYNEQLIKENCGMPEIRQLVDAWEKTGLLAGRAMAGQGSVEKDNPWTRFCRSSS
jgi:hypothetical protein